MLNPDSNTRCVLSLSQSTLVVGQTKYFFGHVSAWAAPLQLYSNRNSKFMIKDPVSIPLWDVGKMLMTKLNTNSEITAAIFKFLGNLSRSLTGLLLSPLKTSWENDMEVFHPFPLRLTREQFPTFILYHYLDLICTGAKSESTPQCHTWSHWICFNN